MTEIFLILAFNFPNYKIIPLLDAMYRPAFQNIAYCGYQDNESTPLILKLQQDGYSLFTYPKPKLVTHGGFSLSQICSFLVIKQFQNRSIQVNDFCSIKSIVL